MNCLLGLGLPSAFLAFVLAYQSAAQEPALPPEVQKAMDRGVKFLQGLQQQDGSWPHDRKVGATALAAWTLLECGVSPNDPGIRRAVDYTRQAILHSDRTYEISLAILLLDRLGDPGDALLLEILTMQLMAGQGTRHGWTYTCPPLPQRELTRLQQQLAKQKENGPRMLPEKPAAQTQRDPKLVDPDVMSLALNLNKALVPRPIPGVVDEADNSNTQFALLALWVGRRHGMPVDLALERVQTRFRSTQHKSGGWAYDARPLGVEQKPPQPTATMTACGLLALAVAAGLTDKGTRGNFNKDEVVIKGLYAVSASLGDPGQPRDKLVLANPGRSYYFLWTLERMAVIYNLKTIGGKDWHAWGLEVILANQQADGGWRGEFAQGGCDTCFALLFLRKANVAKDLTERIGTQVQDPGAAPARLLDLIGSEVQPGIENKMPKKK
jgi:hypothetical protein